MSRVMGRGTARRTPFTNGGPKIVVALDGDLTAAAAAEVQKTVDRLVADIRAQSGRDVQVEFVAASSLENPNIEADFWFAAAPKPRAGFTLLFVSARNQVFE